MVQNACKEVKIYAIVESEVGTLMMKIIVWCLFDLFLFWSIDVSFCLFGYWILFVIYQLYDCNFVFDLGLHTAKANAVTYLGFRELSNSTREDQAFH